MATKNTYLITIPVETYGSPERNGIDDDVEKKMLRFFQDMVNRNGIADVLENASVVLSESREMTTEEFEQEWEETNGDETALISVDDVLFIQALIESGELIVTEDGDLVERDQNPESTD